MGSNNWVRNKQTVDVHFYIFSYRNIDYNKPFSKKNQRIAKRIYDTVLKRNKIKHSRIGSLFFMWFYLLFFKRCHVPFSHVVFSYSGAYHETREGIHFWRTDEFVNERYTLVETLSIPVDKFPSSEELLAYTKSLDVHKGSACPKALAFGLALIFLPIRILKYPRITNDCVTVTANILKMFGVETKETSWTPKMLYNDLIKKENVCKKKWTYSKNSS